MLVKLEVPLIIEHRVTCISVKTTACQRLFCSKIAIWTPPHKKLGRDELIALVVNRPIRCMFMISICCFQNYSTSKAIRVENRSHANLALSDHRKIYGRGGRDVL